MDSMEVSLLGVKPTLSHVLARQEVRQLISILEVETPEKSSPWTVTPEKRAEPTATYAV
jgi:hypothetical protein